jgi:hypothetical protein
MKMSKIEIIQRLINVEIIASQHQSEVDLLKDVLTRLLQLEKHMMRLESENNELKKIIRTLHPEIFS